MKFGIVWYRTEYSYDITFVYDVITRLVTRKSIVFDAYDKENVQKFVVRLLVLVQVVQYINFDIYIDVSFWLIISFQNNLTYSYVSRIVELWTTSTSFRFGIFPAEYIIRLAVDYLARIQ